MPRLIPGANMKFLGHSGEADAATLLKNSSDDALIMVAKGKMRKCRPARSGLGSIIVTSKLGPINVERW